MNDAGPTAINYPRVTREYCECSTDKIMLSFTEDEYVEISQKSQEIQMKELLPKFQICADELKRRIDSTDRIMERIELEKQKRNLSEN